MTGRALARLRRSPAGAATAPGGDGPSPPRWARSARAAAARLAAAARRDPRSTLVGLAAMLLTAVAGWTVVLGGARADLAEQRRGAADARDRIPALEAAIAAGAADARALQEQAAELEGAALALPEGRRLPPATLVELERLAGEAGVRLVSVQQAPGQAFGPVATESLTITASGGFLAIRDLIARIHALADATDPAGPLRATGQLLAVTRVEMASVADDGDAAAVDGAEPSAGEVTATVQALAFMWAPGAAP